MFAKMGGKAEKRAGYRLSPIWKLQINERKWENEATV